MCLKLWFVFPLLVFSGCVPNLTGGESWGRAIFDPSRESGRIACDAGYQYVQRAGRTQDVGAISFGTPKGIVALSTKLGKVYASCASDALIGFQKPFDAFSQYETDVLVADPDFLKQLIKVSISIEDENKKEIGRLTTRKSEVDKYGRRYVFNYDTTSDVLALDNAVSFSIVVEMETSTIRYKVDQRLQPYGPPVYARSPRSKTLDRQPLLSALTVRGR